MRIALANRFRVSSYRSVLTSNRDTMRVARNFGRAENMLGMVIRLTRIMRKGKPGSRPFHAYPVVHRMETGQRHDAHRGVDLDSLEDSTQNEAPQQLRSRKWRLLAKRRPSRLLRW